ncbi:unnamed protein product (macronuclear) [Paramecium tetraurelia]|uniref:HTH psq-type domain-containing protein n=2 Tax=Paramecium TaxID=5884 RepID=A0E243_PARTE|nr:uncharacterized protein GSPATT00022532001 [Paramecium tetraurelia]CAD8192919.1 unnamed protein product [Paramecium octaurelia]CAK89360.1 unnamed protein product [Paramecium tetraurelia]|eukprot:XP_001456757.1 hypothetical protein (macronuclear) [Paramecium tetraurelia strain d4-2]
MKKDSSTKRPYEKVSKIKRQNLVKLVFHQGIKIKHAAKHLKINYAAAKTVISQHRCNVILQNVQYKSNQRCGFTTITNSNRSFSLISKLAGEIIKATDHTIQEIKKV